MREIITTTAEDGTETEQILDFRYDNAGLPYALHYTDTFEGIEQTYYYITNLQGDVMYMVDEGGGEVASYDYDPYGKLLYARGDMAEVNPIRYRGYYYDTETDFYYLQSRYYDPAICRFVNYDGYASTGQGLVGYNMFAYCNNNPVIYADPTGNRPIWERKYGGVTMYTDGGSGDSKYDRNAAVGYAKKWYLDCNDQYYNYSQDCTNFTSQCLVAGGIEMTEGWHCYKNGSYKWYNPLAWFNYKYGYDWDVVFSWSVAEDQFNYFSNPANGYIRGNVITISSPSGIESVAKFGGVRQGDLMYFVNEGDGIHHSTIITKVENGMIYFAGHTSPCFDRPLGISMDSEAIYIIRIGY